MSEAVKTRREREEESRRAHILDAAERLFAQRGLIDTSVADIAKESEFGIGTLYKYFKDKNTLIQSLLDERLNAHFDEMEAALKKEGSPAEIVDAVIECQLDSYLRRRLFFIIYFTHFHPGTVDGYAGYTGALDHSTTQKRQKEVLRTLEQVFEKGTACGQFTDVEGRFLSSALFGMFISFSFLNGRNTFPNSSVNEMKIAIKRILFDQVLLTKDDKKPTLEIL